jgi:hypothetical protein
MSFSLKGKISVGWVEGSISVAVFWQTNEVDNGVKWFPIMEHSLLWHDSIAWQVACMHQPADDQELANVLEVCQNCWTISAAAV